MVVCTEDYVHDYGSADEYYEGIDRLYYTAGVGTAPYLMVGKNQVNNSPKKY